MEYAQLGRSRAEVSRLCLGTMNFGPKTSEETSHEIMDAAVAAGINFFDTANVYGWRRGEGWTEQIVGRWLAQKPGRRDGIVLATKVYGAMGDGRNDQGLSALHIRQACDASLRRLQTDHIDLYQLHHIDRRTPLEELWQALDILVAQGKVLYVGSSNFAAWHLVRANEAAARRGTFGLVTEQPLYNLASRAIELELLPACRAYGVGVLPWSPLFGGVLAGSERQSDGSRRGDAHSQERLEAHREQIEQYEDFCRERGERPADVALAWLLHQDGVTAPIIGPRTVEQLDATLHAVDVHLDSASLERLDQIWPGPGGEAPEAYAW